MQAALRASRRWCPPIVLARALGSVQLSREVEGELTSLGNAVRLSDIDASVTKPVGPCAGKLAGIWPSVKPWRDPDLTETVQAVIGSRQAE